MQYNMSKISSTESSSRRSYAAGFYSLVSHLDRLRKIEVLSNIDFLLINTFRVQLQIAKYAARSFI